MKHQLRTVLVTAAVTAATVVALPATDAAPPKKAKVIVTIDGNDGPFGLVKSGKRVCKANVTVTVLRVVGSRGGGDDDVVGTDVTSPQGGPWSWSIGNPGLEDGDRVYAKVKATGSCRYGASPTMTVDKSD